MPQTDIRTELERAAPEPLLPVEKKLIGFSLGIGLVLLVVLAASSPSASMRRPGRPLSAPTGSASTSASLDRPAAFQRRSPCAANALRTRR